VWARCAQGSVDVQNLCRTWLRDLGGSGEHLPSCKSAQCCKKAGLPLFVIFG